MTDPGTLGGSATDAAGINDAGTVVGWSFRHSGNTYSHAFSYSDGVMTDLGTLGGVFSFASAINNAGTIVGYSSSPGVQHAFSYSGGVMTDLGNIGGKSPLQVSEAFAINNAGAVAGFSTVGEYQDMHAFIYINGVMTDLGTLGGVGSSALGVNDAGAVVGWSDITGSSTLQVGPGMDAFVDSGGVMTDLAPYLTRIGITDGSLASAIAGNGDIVGYGQTAGGNYEAFLLQTPEPSTMTVLALGFVGLAWRTLRRRLAA